MSSFEAINRYAKGHGIPIVLDPIKLKNLSCVRKQSEMERDLPSKFRNLSEAASWTNRNWPTYDLHQIALLIGVEIFDFMRAKQYPYLQEVGVVVQFHPESDLTTHVYVEMFLWTSRSGNRGEPIASCFLLLRLTRS